MGYEIFMANSKLLKYKKISNFFLSEIKNGKFEVGERLPSERALAKKYNLAHMTVNKALNGLVATGHLERRRGDGTYVCEQKLPKTACLVLDYMDDIHSIFPYILQKALFEAGYIVTVFDTVRVSRNKDMLEAYLSNYPELLIIDGLSLFPFELLEQVPETTQKIFFQRCETELGFDASYVLVDVEQCGYKAAEQLLLSGREKILIVTEKSEHEYDQQTQFFNGAVKALAKHNIKPAVFEHEICWEKGNAGISESEALKLLNGDKRPDGIMAFADCELLPFIAAAENLGISIPEELSLIGRCNTPWAEKCNLTSIDIQPDLIVENIKNVLNQKENRKIIVKPEIVFRESCPKLN